MARTVAKARANKPSDRSKRRASKRSLTDALAEAAWSEADAALADALVEYDAVTMARRALDRKQAMALLGQSLSRAGRKRGLTRLGEVGKREPYDPKRHQLEGAGTTMIVRVTARGVARGGEVLVKPRAVPATRRKQRP